jgi:anti-sigma B factor antagonist
MRLQLDVSKTGDVAIVRCRGDVVFGPEEDELRLTGLSLLKETNHVLLLLDGIERIDSEGVAVLVGLYISARNRGGEVKLAELSPKCSRVLHITRIEKVFEIYETEEQALASFHPPKAA